MAEPVLEAQDAVGAERPNCILETDGVGVAALFGYKGPKLELCEVREWAKEGGKNELEMAAIVPKSTPSQRIR